MIKGHPAIARTTETESEFESESRRYIYKQTLCLSDFFIRHGMVTEYC